MFLPSIKVDVIIDFLSVGKCQTIQFLIMSCLALLQYVEIDPFHYNSMKI